MNVFAKTLVSGLFAAGVLAAPAAIAQTSNTVQSTGGATFTKDRRDADSVRKHQTLTPKRHHRAAKKMHRRHYSNSTPKNGRPLGPTNTRG